MPETFVQVDGELFPSDAAPADRTFRDAWSVENSAIVIDTEKAQQIAWDALRTDRDARLTATDWVILRNLETSEPVPEAWLEYRAALRDLPDNTDDPANPDWPEAPSAS